MTATAPLLEILFAVFLLIMPEGTTSFTMTCPEVCATPIIWTLQPDGSWSGLTQDGQTAMGPWKTKKWQVIQTDIESQPESEVDLTPWIARDEAGFLLEGTRLQITHTNDGGWLFTTRGGPFAQPARIEVHQPAATPDP